LQGWILGFRLQGWISRLRNTIKIGKNWGHFFAAILSKNMSIQSSIAPILYFFELFSDFEMLLAKYDNKSKVTSDCFKN